MIVLLSGDVETNPGPVCNNTLGFISLVHLNIRSIRNKLSYIFDNFSDFDILCFTETHLDNQIDDNHLLAEWSNFKLYKKDISLHSGGLVCYVRNNLLSKQRHDLEVINIQNLWLEVSYKSRTLLICVAYRPPNSPVCFWDDLNLSIERALDINPKIIVLGDLNENLLNDNLVHLRNLIFINDLENVINEPTRITQHSSTLIDPILESKD